ncbi:MAG: glucuronate isomerase [Monoglobaceae bacterium]
MNKDFLLRTDFSKKVYHEIAENLPIIDYHNHLSLEDIKENKRFDNIYDLWLKPDPYKHRAMRMCGVHENFITGDASDVEKFRSWCEIFPNLIGNPLYNWSLMELQYVLSIDMIPNPDNWEDIWNKADEYLRSNTVSVNTLLDRFNVEYACPCASVTDDITMFEHNERMAPSLRGDNIVYPSAEFIDRLSEITNVEINDLKSMKKAVSVRLNEFKEVGCRFSDHAIDNGFIFYEDDGKNDERFQMILNGRELADIDKKKFISYMLVFLGGEYAGLNFVMQLHIGAQRYTSTRLRSLAGAAGGFAGIGNSVDVSSLTAFFDTLEKTKYGLPKTVMFTLNPADNALISVLSGSYSKDNTAGLITQGPAWWWCDHNYGITEVMENVSAFGLLSNFIGMTTDSRSFLSLVRHDYFRRVLSEWIGKKVEAGEFPDSIELIKDVVYKVCYKNAKNILDEV